MKANQKMLEDLYNYVGLNERKLKEEYKFIPKGNFSFSQYCILSYSNLNENNTPTKPTK